MSRPLPFLALGLGGACFSSSFSAVEDEGISNHSSPSILNGLIKNGQSFVSMFTDSIASALEMGTGDDLTIAVEISDNGSARRFREDGVAVVEPAGPENNLQKPCKCQDAGRCKGQELTSKYSPPHHRVGPTNTSVASLPGPTSKVGP